jgi:sortase A
MTTRKWISLLLTIVGLYLILNSLFKMQSSEQQAFAQEKFALKVELDWNNFQTSDETKQVAATIRIPRLGKDWVRTIREGVSEAQLNAGIGHYPQTNNVGEKGNYGLAGHRTGWGDALFDADKLVKGDEIKIKTATNEYVYTVVCHVVVSPEEVGVLNAVPNQKCAGSGKMLTLTTCTPKYINTSRYIIFARLKETL